MLDHYFQKYVAWSGPARTWPWLGQAMAKWRLRRSQWRGPGVPRVPGPHGLGVHRVPGPAPLASPPAPLGNGLARPWPGPGQAGNIFLKMITN